MTQTVVDNGLRKKMKSKMTNGYTAKLKFDA